MTRPHAIPVVILTGFLGSGKTTLLNEVLADPAFVDTAVIVNEFGDISIDHDLVRVGRREMMVTTTGCLCCTAGSDIRSSLFDLHEAARVGLAPGFSRVIVETTGLADLAPVINQLVPGGAPALGYRDHVVARAFRAAGVVCTVDATTADLTLDRHFECLKQIAFADRLVLTKTDMVRDPASRHDVQALQARLGQINPAAPISDRNASDFDASVLFTPRGYSPGDLGVDAEGWLALEQILASEPHKPHRHDGPDGPGGIRTFSVVSSRAVRREAFDRFLMLLRAAADTRLLRLKGLVRIEGDERPLVVHCVQHAVHPPARLESWPSDDRRTRLVLIAYEVDPAAVEDLFEAVTAEPRRARSRR